MQAAQSKSVTHKNESYCPFSAAGTGFRLSYCVSMLMAIAIALPIYNGGGGAYLPGSNTP